MRKSNLAGCAVFFDFDNTITHFDVLDSVVENFSVDKKWMDYEEAWKKRKIGSKDCLFGQLKSVRVNKKRLDGYLHKIKVDPYFRKIIALLAKDGISPVILSDSFSYFIKSILKHNGIEGIKIYSNRIKFSGDRLLPVFPHQHPSCTTCGNCKSNHLPAGKLDKRVIIYVGDGLSDLCPSKNSDIVFAKGSLKKYLLKEGKPFISFGNLKSVYNFMRRMAG